MLLLRTLLDTVGTVPGDAKHNFDLVQAMFSHTAASPSTISHSLSSSTAAGRTAAFVKKQLAVHQQLWAMSEGYTTNDTRTVRSVDVSQLDELYDIVQEACCTNLFAIRGGDGGDTQAATAVMQGERATHDSASETENNSEKCSAPASGPTARQLLLDALVKRFTVAEMQYLFNKLPKHLQAQWTLLSSEQ